MLANFARVCALGRVASDSTRNPEGGATFTFVAANGLAPQLVIPAVVPGDRARYALSVLRAGVLVYLEGGLVLSRKRHRDGTVSERYFIDVGTFTVVDSESKPAAERPAPPAKISEPLFGHQIEGEPEPV